RTYRSPCAVHRTAMHRSDRNSPSRLSKSGPYLRQKTDSRPSPIPRGCHPPKQDWKKRSSRRDQQAKHSRLREPRGAHCREHQEMCKKNCHSSGHAQQMKRHKAHTPGDCYPRLFVFISPKPPCQLSYTRLSFLSSVKVNFSGFFTFSFSNATFKTSSTVST